MYNTKAQGNDHKVAGTQERRISKAAEKRNRFIEKAKAYAKEKGVAFTDKGGFITIGSGKHSVTYHRNSFSSFKDLKTSIDIA